MTPASAAIAPPALGAHDVHVWSALLPDERLPADEALQDLSADEQARAGRFKFPLDARRYRTARALLRRVLAAYLNCASRELEFGYLERGKPFLRGAGDLQFNSSHSGEAVLIGVTRAREIGVDVERIRRDIEARQIAVHFFSSAERAALAQVPEAQQHLAFFRCWTRKEAFLKATAEGLSRPLDTFDVTVAPGEPAQLLATRPNPLEARGWVFMEPIVNEDYAAAIITQGGADTLRYWAGRLD